MPPLDFLDQFVLLLMYVVLQTFTAAQQWGALLMLWLCVTLMQTYEKLLIVTDTFYHT